jgi:acyl-CoA thioesterase I
MTTSYSPTDAKRRHFIRYTHTQHWPMLQRFPIDEDLHHELLAQMLACSPEATRSIIEGLAAEARVIAAQMLEDQRFRDAVRALPFRPEDRIVGVGDSITADRLGWFELLSTSAVLAGAPIGEMVNFGLSGNTTADVLERFDLLESVRPSHVVLMLGTNDARSHGRAVECRMVTTSETERNLRALIDLIANNLGATIAVLTPPVVDQRRIDTFFADTPVRWHAAEVAEVAEVVRKVAPSGLDLHSLTQAHGTDDILEADGVHPTPTGQRMILAHIVDHLGGSANRSATVADRITSANPGADRLDQTTAHAGRPRRQYRLHQRSGLVACQWCDGRRRRPRTGPNCSGQRSTTDRTTQGSVGSTSRNTAPCPGLVSTSSRPPCPLAMAAEIARPRPEPPSSRERAGSTR